MGGRALPRWGAGAAVGFFYFATAEDDPSPPDLEPIKRIEGGRGPLRLLSRAQASEQGQERKGRRADSRERPDPYPSRFFSHAVSLR